MLWNRGMISIVALAGGVFPATLGQPAVAREELAILTPDDPSGVYRFGAAVAISGDYVVVGAPSAAGLGIRGAAIVFKREGMNWIEQAKLWSWFSWDAFGESVAIDGDLIVVGAPYFGPIGHGEGYTCIFRRQGTEWVEDAFPLWSSGSAVDDYFGGSVAVSGDLVVVGAHGEQSDTGAAYVFRYDSGQWIEEDRLTPNDLGDGDAFGWSVSIGGDLVVVGALRDDDACPDDPRCNSGSAYIFRTDGTNWVEEAKLTASDAGESDVFGVSVSISGDSVVIGAPRAAGVHPATGSAYVFRLDGVNWTQEAKLIASDGEPYDDFGVSVASEGDLIVVGAPCDDDAGTCSGSAYLFKRYEGSWYQLDKLVVSDAHTTEAVGVSVGVAGELAAVGAFGALNESYVFALGGDIPAVPRWGTIAMALLVLTAGAILIGRGHSGQLEPERGDRVGQYGYRPGNVTGLLSCLPAPCGRGIMRAFVSKERRFL